VNRDLTVGVRELNCVSQEIEKNLRIPPLVTLQAADKVKVVLAVN